MRYKNIVKNKNRHDTHFATNRHAKYLSIKIIVCKSKSIVKRLLVKSILANVQ